MNLAEACTNGNLERVKELISVKVQNRALKLVAEYGHLDIVKYLIERGADIHTCDDYSLRIASCCGHLKVVQYLIENGADIHANDIQFSITCHALRLACWNGHLDVVKCLLKNGADIPDMDLGNPSTYEYYGHLEIVEYMDLVKSLKILSKPWKERQKFKRIKE